MSSRLDAKIDRIEAQLENILEAQFRLDAVRARNARITSELTPANAEEREEAQLAAEDTDRIIEQERYHS